MDAEAEVQNGSSANAHNASSGNTQNGMNGVPAAKRSRTDLGQSEKWVVKASRESHDCINPVRSCEEKYFAESMALRDKTKSLIKLSIGEPVGLKLVTEIPPSLPPSYE